MAGIYIHIPFCKQACYYCDFHFSTNTKLKSEFIKSLLTEIELQKDYLIGEKISSIYLGGGTPSLLSPKETNQILEFISQHHRLENNCEITLEANPDDLNFVKLQDLKSVGINRLSIGIQSFNEEHLKFMNRAHNAKEAHEVIQNSRKAGFNNISLDLIYAVPSQNHQTWEQDIKQVLEYKPEHISAYCLTIEEKTVFGKWKKQNKLKEADEDFASEQFEILLEATHKYDYEQYEISNFAKKGFESHHNSNYWKQVKYLGLGPSAHSYDGKTRQFNISNNKKYIESVNHEKVPFEKIILDTDEQINEYILTSLRTSWGTNLSYLKEKYDCELESEKESQLDFFTENGFIERVENHLILTKSGKLLADKIASDLFR